MLDFEFSSSRAFEVMISSSSPNPWGMTCHHACLEGAFTTGRVQQEASVLA